MIINIVININKVHVSTTIVRMPVIRTKNFKNAICALTLFTAMNYLSGWTGFLVYFEHGENCVAELKSSVDGPVVISILKKLFMQNYVYSVHLDCFLCDLTMFPVPIMTAGAQIPKSLHPASPVKGDRPETLPSHTFLG